MLDSVPKLRWSDLVVTVHKNVSHSFYRIPFHILMLVAEFLAEHIYGFSDDLKLLDETKEDNGIAFDFIQFESILIVKDNVDG